MHNYLKFAIIDANNTADLQDETIRNIFVCGCKILQGKRQESEKEEYEEQSGPTVICAGLNH